MVKFPPQKLATERGGSVVTHETRIREVPGSNPPPLSTPLVQWLSYSPLDPRFAGSIPAGVDEFFQRV